MYQHELEFGNGCFDEAEKAPSIIEQLLPDVKIIPPSPDGFDPFATRYCFWTQEELSVEQEALIRKKIIAHRYIINTPLDPEKAPEIKLQVGMGATLCYPNDRYPFTIIAIERKPGQYIDKLFVMQRDKEIVTGGKWPALAYRYEPEPTSRDIEFVHLRRNGRWTTSGGTPVSIGARRYYQAPEI